MRCYRETAARFHARGSRGEGIAVGLLDTGVDADHPLLDGRVATFAMADPAGFAIARASARDTASHGTFIAGLLAGGAEIGIAPAARLHVAAVIEEGAVVARILLGLDWLSGIAPAVVCLSLGVPAGPAVFAPLIDALVARDVLVVAAVGNGGAGSAHAPATDPRVLAVGATDGNGSVARWSGSLADPSDGSCRTPDVTAPGTAVVSLAPGGGTRQQAGASVAAALVAGHCALLRQLHPGRSAAEIADALRLSARPPQQHEAHRTRFGAVRPAAASALLATGQSVRTERGHTPVRAPADDPLAVRLRQRLGFAAPDDPVDAIVGFTTFAARDRSLAGLVVTEATLPEFCASLVGHAPLLVLRVRAEALRQLSANEDVTFYGSPDVDRSWFHDRCKVAACGRVAAPVSGPRWFCTASGS